MTLIKQMDHQSPELNTTHDTTGSGWRERKERENKIKFQLTIQFTIHTHVGFPFRHSRYFSSSAVTAMLGGSGGAGGSVYWGRKEHESRGIVVIFSWISIHQKDLDSYVDLYSSLGWNSLVSHADFLSAFYPERALSLAYLLRNELVEELRIRPCPTVFVAFSAAPKACMYKFFQIIQGGCHGHLNLDEGRLVRTCVSGHIFDSSPVDFTSDLGAQFALHPAIQKMRGPSKLVSWVAKGIASGLDGLYLTRFELQREEYWQTLYSSIEMRAPYLILCSESDELAPYKVICKFAKCLQDLGGDVNLVKWNCSPHLGHYKNYPIQYRAAVTSILDKAPIVFYRRIQQLGEGIGMDGMHDGISELICDLQKAADNSNQSLRRVAAGPGDHFFIPSSVEYFSNKESERLQDERKERSMHLSNPPSISAHSVLGQVLFDGCVPKNIEGWDIRFCGSLNGQPIGSARRHSPFHSIKRIRRSRL